MTKLKCFGGSTSLTNFQNVKNDHMGPSIFGENRSLQLLISHFELYQLQNEASRVPKPQECSLRNENLDNLSVL